MALEFWLPDTTIGSGGAVGTPVSMQLVNGNVMVVWSRNGLPGLQYAIYDPLAVEQSSGNLSPSSTVPQYVYALIAQADGGFDVLYRQDGIQGSSQIPDLYLQHFDASLIGGPQLLVQSDFAVASRLPAGTVPLAGGGFAVAYSSRPGAPNSDDRNIALRIVGANGNVGNEITVNTVTAGLQIDPKIASNGQNLFISWWDQTTQDVRGQILTLSGVKIGNEFSIPSTTVGDAGRPRVEAFASGNYIVVWEAINADGADTSNGSARGRLLNSSGVAIGNEFVLNSQTSGFQGAPDVTVMPDDSFFASWFEGSSGYFRWFNSDGTPKASSEISTTFPGSQTDLIRFDDGRIAAFGIASNLHWLIIDARNGNYDGDDRANQLVSRRTGPSTVYGFGGNDTFYGGNSEDNFFGGEGNDVFRSKQGKDTLVGGPGNDTYYLSFNSQIDPNSTTIVETVDGGEDTLYAHDINNLPENIEIGILLEEAFGGRITGNNAANTLIGNGANNTLNGLGGNDSLEGNDGDDTLFGEGGNDALHGGLGNDEIHGGADSDILNGDLGDDTLNGGDGADNLFGLDGADLLFGQSGNDTLHGGLGNDEIEGGAGSDTAVFSGNHSAYTITHDETGVSTIIGPDGTDTVKEIELAQFSDQTVGLYITDTGTLGASVLANPAAYMGSIRDFDGNDLGAGADWVLFGTVDIDRDGDFDHLFINRTIARLAEVNIRDDGKVYFSDHGSGGETRVVGIYVDPLVQSGQVQAGGPNDSQRRFQNDLAIGNIDRVLGADDYDHNGLQEVYFGLTDSTAYLHAYMHADGNIQYANYQSQVQVIEYLTAMGWTASTYAGWFG